MGQFKTIEEYQQRVAALHKQIQPFVLSSYLDANEFIVVFTPGAGADMWLELLTDELCLVNVYRDDRGIGVYYKGEHVFFAGGGGPGAWTTVAVQKIREWFAKNAPEVKLWSGK